MEHVMFFNYSERSTYEKRSGDSANDKVEIYKHLRFTDGTELAFINNNGSFDNGYDNENNYNSNIDNYIYWADDFVPNGRCVLLRTLNKLECWEEETFKMPEERLTNPDLFTRMLKFFQELYKTVSIDNPVMM